MNLSPAPLPPATEAASMLARVRSARDAGQLSECLFYAALCVREAELSFDFESGYHALASAGRLHQGRSEYAEALRYFQEANVWAKGHRLGEWIAPSYHDLFLAYLEAEKSKEAWRSYGMALELYDCNPYIAMLNADATLGHLRDKRAPAITYDAYQGARHLTPHRRGDLCVAVNMVEAASHFSRNLFERVWTPLYEEMRNVDSGECVTRLLISAGESAVRVGRAEEARELARKAKETADAREEDLNRQRADLLL